MDAGGTDLNQYPLVNERQIANVFIEEISNGKSYLYDLQRAGGFVKTEDDAGRHCFGADEFE
jgi:hypothetical protein